MMLLQYAIWGAWSPVLFAYLVTPMDKGGLGLSDSQASWVYNMLPIATTIAPFLTGQLADRLFATQRLLGVLHLLGGGALLLTAAQQSFIGMIACMLLSSLLYAPTLALTNSLAFHHLSNSEKEFGGIRVWGTIGWIVSGLLLTASRRNFPALLTPGGMSDSLFLAGIMALLLGLFSFSLPHTPPKKEGVNPLAFLDALRLLKDRNFAIFVIISFVVSTELMFYYLQTSPFLEYRIGIPREDVPGWMTIAQIAEIFVMALLLPYLLPRMGIRKTMVIGILAWPIRYIIFALGATMPEQLKWLVVASLTLHGFCYVFFFTVGFIYVDQVAHTDIRASAQSLIALVVLGAGSFVGNVFTGWIGDLFTKDGVKNWTGVFLVPCVLTVICAIIFPLLFRERSAPAATEPATA